MCIIINFITGYEFAFKVTVRAAYTELRRANSLSILVSHLKKEKKTFGLRTSIQTAVLYSLLAFANTPRTFFIWPNMFSGLTAGTTFPNGRYVIALCASVWKVKSMCCLQIDFWTLWLGNFHSKKYWKNQIGFKLVLRLDSFFEQSALHHFMNLIIKILSLHGEMACKIYNTKSLRKSY